MSLAPRAVIVASVAALGLTTGCATVARIGNLTEPACQSAFSAALSTILVEQGEKAEMADGLADRAVKNMILVDLGPRPFFVASPSGTDYTFFVQGKRAGCLLRLYGRQRGFWSYTNNLTYIATRPLPNCLCSE
jgi:hypothetical protein